MAAICELCEHHVEVTGDEPAIVRCPICDLRFVYPYPEEVEYPANYGPHAPRTQKSKRFWLAVHNALWRHKLVRLYVHPFGGGRLLDVGCGAGGFAEQARDLGWHVIGVESDHVAAQRARDRGIEVLEAAFDTLGSLPERYDLVRMSHVLEHMRHPLAALRIARLSLADGGRLHVAVPNADSLTARFWRRWWNDLGLPFHRFFFTPRTLQAALDGAGYETIAMFGEPNTYVFWRSAGRWADGHGIHLRWLWVYAAKVTIPLSLIAGLLIGTRTSRIHVLARARS
jgi:SAM-dependent methyltransferase